MHQHTQTRAQSTKSDYLLVCTSPRQNKSFFLFLLVNKRVKEEKEEKERRRPYKIIYILQMLAYLLHAKERGKEKRCILCKRNKKKRKVVIRKYRRKKWCRVFLGGYGSNVKRQNKMYFVKTRQKKGREDLCKSVTHFEKEGKTR